MSAADRPWISGRRRGGRKRTMVALFATVTACMVGSGHGEDAVGSSAARGGAAAAGMMQRRLLSHWNAKDFPQPAPKGVNTKYNPLLTTQDAARLVPGGMRLPFPWTATLGRLVTVKPSTENSRLAPVGGTTFVDRGQMWVELGHLLQGHIPGECDPFSGECGPFSVTHSPHRIARCPPSGLLNPQVFVSRSHP